MSIYSSYSVTFLPRAGESFSSLSLSNQTIDPEKFKNYEVGLKWDVLSDLSFTAAVYRLDRTNVIVPDPNDLNRSLLVDGQRTAGLEIGVAGRPTAKWSLMGGYAHQDGKITRTLSAAAREGAVLAQVPAHSVSFWNRYDVTPRVGFALGLIHSSDMFTSTDNAVTLPAFTRADGALFVSVSKNLRAQLNVENLFDERYYAFANGNNNITPGSPRVLRVSLTTQF
jgi:catecholate siderophore receptor